jgi:hypothetical protein
MPWILAAAALCLQGNAQTLPDAAVPPDANPPAGPAVVIDPPFVDLGIILDSPETAIPVVVRNDSAVPVDIVDVAANLSANIAYEVDDPHLEPGQSALLQLHFSPAGLQGPVQLFVAVIAGDASPSQATLEVRAEVQPCYRVAGSPVAFFKVIQGQPQSWRVAIEPLIGLQDPLDTVVSEVPGIEGAVHYDESRGRYLVDIVAGADLAPGLHQTFLSVESSAGTAPPCLIPLGATVQEPFLVLPDRLVVGRTPREQLRMIVLEHHGDTPLLVTQVDLPGPNCRYRLYREDDVSKTWMNLYFYNAHRMDVAGDVVIHTNHPAHPVVTVPVSTQDVGLVIVNPDCPQAKAASRRIGS